MTAYLRAGRIVITSHTFFAGPNNYNMPYIARVLAHELVVRFDSKISWGASGKLGSIYKGDNSCEIISAIQNPAIRHSFTALRAIKLENQILKELNFPETDLSSKSCKEKLLWILPSVIAMNETYIMEYPIWKQSQKLACKSEVVGVEDLENILNLLSTQTVTNENGLNVNLCEYLTSPANFNTIRKHSLITGGPRPRIGSGSNSEEPDLKSIFKKHQETAFNQIKKFEDRDSRLKHVTDQLKLEVDKLDSPE